MIEVDSLIKVYPGSVAALRGVSFTAGNGMFGLLGPNGAGKTTLMRILAGLLEPTSGTIRLDGRDVTRHPELVWPQLGYLPQDFGFYPNLSGEAMLTYMLRLKGVSAPQGLRALTRELLERVNLASAANRKTKHYSGGMRRRLGIAQAIAGNPSIVIVDEPTAGLDPEERQRFYRLLTEVAQERTVLLSTHIVEDVATLCPHFAIMRDGRILLQSTPATSRRELEGRLFSGELTIDGESALSESAVVTKSHLIEGRSLSRVFIADFQHDAVSIAPGLEPVDPTLEDVYMLAIHRDRLTTRTSTSP